MCERDNNIYNIIYIIPFYPIRLNASKCYDADDNNLSENSVLNVIPNAHDISTSKVTLDITCFTPSLTRN